MPWETPADKRWMSVDHDNIAVSSFATTQPKQTKLPPFIGSGFSFPECLEYTFANTYRPTAQELKKHDIVANIINNPHIPYPIYDILNLPNRYISPVWPGAYDKEAIATSSEKAKSTDKPPAFDSIDSIDISRLYCAHLCPSAFKSLLLRKSAADGHQPYFMYILLKALLRLAT